MPMPFNQQAYELKDIGMKGGSAADAEKTSFTPSKTQICFAIEWDDGELCVAIYSPEKLAEKTIPLSQVSCIRTPRSLEPYKR
jgi:hypothetical protein